MLRAVLLRASDSALLRREVTRRPATRRVVRRFVAGETIEEALSVARELARRGAMVTLDYLGEDVTDPDEARSAAAVVGDVLSRIGTEALPAEVSVKPTQLGLGFDPGLARALLARIASAAEHAGSHVTLDMEGSGVTEGTVAMAEESGRDAVGCAVQAYLRRTPADLRRLTDAGASVRLCKGAYAEPAALAFRSRAAVAASFASCADWLLEHGVYPRLATHDHRLIERAQQSVARLGLARSAFEFQMLYGVRPSLQQALVAEGWPLRIYVPFGSQWYRYLVRRLAERPANVAFLLRALRGDARGRPPLR